MTDMHEDDPDAELYDDALPQAIGFFAEIIQAVARAGPSLRQSEIDHALNVDSSRQDAHLAA